MVAKASSINLAARSLTRCALDPQIAERGLRSIVQTQSAYAMKVFGSIRDELRAKRVVTNRDVKRIAGDWNLTESTVRDIHKARRLEDLVTDSLAEHYGLAASTVRVLRADQGGSKRRRHRQATTYRHPSSVGDQSPSP